MPYTVLEKKLKAIPEQYFEQVSSFLDIILSVSPNSSDKNSSDFDELPIFGLAEREFSYPDDINLHDDKITDLFGV